MKKICFILFLICPVLGFCDIDLQKLVDEAAAGTGELHLKKGNYTLNQSLRIPSNFKLFGNGAIIEPANSWRNENADYVPLIEVVNVSNVYLSGLILDNKAERGLQSMPPYSILILGSSSIIIENNIFKDLGLKRDNKSRHGSPFILVAAQEATNDFSYIPKKYAHVKSSVENLQILKNTFVNEDYVNSFAIRLVTLWTKSRKKESFKNKINNVTISENKFYGEYDWNTLEMAGPATRNITVEKNLFSGKSINNIDVDKGASDIVIRGNTLTNLGLPSRHKSNKNVRVSPIMIHGNGNGYECENVQVLNNIIENVKNPDIENSRFLYSSGIGVLHSKNVEIIGNRITNIFVGKNYGAAICLDQSVSDINIRNNFIDEAYRGIVVTPNTKSFNNILIEDNKVSTWSEPLMVLTAQQGNFSNLKVRNNTTRSNNNKKVTFSKSIKEIESDVK
jgi:hypothetical protein